MLQIVLRPGAGAFLDEAVREATVDAREGLDLLRAGRILRGGPGVVLEGGEKCLEELAFAKSGLPAVGGGLDLPEQTDGQSRLRDRGE